MIPRWMRCVLQGEKWSDRCYIHIVIKLGLRIIIERTRKLDVSNKFTLHVVESFSVTIKSHPTTTFPVYCKKEEKANNAWFKHDRVYVTRSDRCSSPSLTNGYTFTSSAIRLANHWTQTPLTGFLTTAPTTKLEINRKTKSNKLTLQQRISFQMCPLIWFRAILKKDWSLSQGHDRTTNLRFKDEQSCDTRNRWVCSVDILPNLPTSPIIPPLLVLFSFFLRMLAWMRNWIRLVLRAKLMK